jgi:2'-hydroxyisoflavone reductase
MRILFVGGTRFVGRAMAEAAVAAGHQVTLLHRGKTSPGTLAAAEHLLADRDGDLSALQMREFDATIDVCAYLPRQVESLAAALGTRGGHHVYVSTMSVYADDVAGPGLDEYAKLTATPDPETDTLTEETYGGLKVLCERAAVAAYGEDNVAIVRPTYVIGPEDYSFRFPWWVRRIATGGEILSPGPAASPMSVIDARDQGAWTVRLAETGAAGPFNGIGTSLPFTFEDLLIATRDAVAPDGASLAWVDGRWLAAQGVTGRDLPLWNEGGDEWTLAGDNARALATGLNPRPLAETVADTLAWMQDPDLKLPDSWGLPADRETALLALWHDE